MLNKYCYNYANSRHGVVYNAINGEMRLYDLNTYNKIVQGQRLSQEIYDDLVLNDFFDCSKSSNFFIEAFERLKIHKRNNSRLKIRVFTTTRCNAKCPYCYEKGIEHKDFTIELADSLVEYITEIISKFNYKTLHIEWFGGEPLLKLDIIKYLLEKLNSNLSSVRILSSFVTNGFLITDETIDFMVNFAKTQSVQITIDGTKAVYEKIKQLGENSFEKVINTVHNLVNAGIKVLIRINYDENNVEDVKDLIKYLGKQSFASKIIVGCLPIFDDGSKKDSIDLVTRFNEEFLRELYRNGFLNLSNIMPRRKYYPCVAKTEHYLAFYVNGNIYSCDRSFSDETVIDNLNSHCINYNMDFDVCGLNDKCKECKYLPICFGGCEYERKLGKSGCEFNDMIIKGYLKVLIEMYEDLVEVS